MKRSLIMLTIITMLANLVIPAYAVENNYTYVDNDVTVITPESFENEFGVDSVSKIMYNYEMLVSENNSRAMVAMSAEIFIGGDSYATAALGTINSYELPSGDVLWEGPIKGNVTIGSDEFNLTVGFSKLTSTQNLMISFTLQNNSSLIVLSFGDNILNGEVLNFFNERAKKSSETVNSASNSMNSVSSLEGTPDVSVNKVLPGFSVIVDPGEGGSLDIGPNQEFEYQSAQTKSHENTSYDAHTSRVYWDEDRYIMIVAIAPYIEETQDYWNTLGYDSAAVSLQGFSIKLSVDSNAPATSYGYISGIHIPGLINSTSGTFDMTTEFLESLFYDVLDLVGIPTNTLTTVVENLKGSAEGINNLYDGLIQIVPSANSHLLDYDYLSYIGMPFRFQLAKSNVELYEGNTAYTVTVTTNYSVVTVKDYMPYTYYVEAVTTHSGTVDMR